MSRDVKQSKEVNRRAFLRGSSFATLMAVVGGTAARAEDKAAESAPADERPVGPPVNCAVIGCGPWGREILSTLGRLPNAPVVAVCDNYASSLRRGREAAPNAEAYASFEKVLDNKEVQAIVIATPSHQHRDLTLAALQAGKHVYCEAPMATTIEDARAIAQAARAAERVNFHVGLQLRSNPHRRFLLTFVRSGATGKPVKAYAQWHKKQSWRRTSPNPDREKETNWRLDKNISLGLAGEVGIHQLDLVNWFHNALPVAVSGQGAIVLWDDGRDVPDTVHALLEYPGAVQCYYTSSLANSFDSEYELLYGTDSAIMLRGDKAWMFKEVDAPLLGWEVYARKDAFYQETGIALAMDATKSAAQGEGQPQQQQQVAPVTPPLQHALEAFIANSSLIATGVEDFIDAFGANAKGLKEYLADLAKNRLPAAGYQEGYESTIVALKTNEAILSGQRVQIPKELFTI